MITTKGIIEKVEVIGGVVQYRVRIPMFYETQASSDVITNQLPLAIYPMPPHMETTRLNVGDVVYVTLEDGGLDNVVILGLIPHSSIPNTSGSDSTESKLSVSKIDSADFDINGSAVLPYNIKIRTNVTEDLIEDNIRSGEIRNYVNGEDLSYIRGLDKPLMETLEKLSETLNYLETNLLHIEVRAEMLEEGTPS